MSRLFLSVLRHSILLRPVGRRVVVASGTSALLLTTGDYLLLTSNDHLLLSS